MSSLLTHISHHRNLGQRCSRVTLCTFQRYKTVSRCYHLNSNGLRNTIAKKNRKPSSTPSSVKHPVLIDIGINGTHKKIKLEWGALVRRAIEAGVERIKLTGTSFRNSLESSLMARAWYEENGTPNLFASCGVHPHNSNQFQKTHITKLRALCADPFVVSMGESGLDYNQQRMFSTREQQCLAFRTQLQLACELQMPFFLHEREAHDDFISILDEFRNCRNNNRHNNKKLPPIVIHCFTGKKEEAMAYLERGFYIGLTGFICKKNRGQHVRDFLRDIPLDRIMLETDCPFMNFQQDVFSEPMDVVGVAEKLSEVIQVPFEEVCRQTTLNAREFFRLDQWEESLHHKF